MSRSLAFRLSQLSLVLLLSIGFISLSSNPVQALSWDFWHRLLNSPPPVPVSRLGSRGGYLCLIAPDRYGKVLGQNPALVWKGTLARVELLDSNQGILWSQDTGAIAPLPNQNTASGQEAYRVAAAIALTAAESYRWRIYREADREPLTIPFQVLSPSEQATLQLPTPGLKRADALANAQLWADFWSEILSIAPSTPEIENLVNTTFTQLCPSDSGV